MSLSNELLTNLKNYMFTLENISKATKHIIQINIRPQASRKNIDENIYGNNLKDVTAEKKIYENNLKNVTAEKKNINKNIYENNLKNIAVANKNIYENNLKNIVAEKKNIYKPKQKDSLFWCFYILKHGFFNYETEVGNQYFTVEKTQKFKYIETLRKNKDLLKIHKIKPLTELEDDLANKARISIKTFFALCVLENINVLLVDKRKIYEIQCLDNTPIHIIHRNGKTCEHHIQLDTNETDVNNYRNTYYKMTSFDSTIKSISAYKTDELIDLCRRLDIDITSVKLKKDIYELLVQQF